MKTRGSLIFPLILLFIVVAGISGVIYFQLNKQFYRFAEFQGPSHEDRIIEPVNVSLGNYAQGRTSRLAVLVTDTNSDWTGLVRGLKSIGVPFTVTQQPQEAVNHKVVLAYPTVSGKLLGEAGLKRLASFVAKGGVLVGVETFGAYPQSLFGVADATTFRRYKHIKLEPNGARFFELTESEELEIPVNGKSENRAAYSYALDGATTLARYDDGQPAIVKNSVGKGSTYLFGVDIGNYLAQAYNLRHEAGRKYINVYEPAVDVLLRMLRQIYLKHEPLAVVIEPAPDGKDASVIITHDVDYNRSIENALSYAEYEHEQGISATYFIQTKYLQDWNDQVFFNKRGAELTNKLAALGMEIGSHSVSHSRIFSRFPLGTGTEAYPDYMPIVTDKWDAENGTILGELRISRFLLESVVPGLTVRSFRAGHLQYPLALPQALQATGYRYNSGASSGTVLTHLPYELTYSQENGALVSVFEFPITIEDQDDRPMTGRLASAIGILEKLRRYGGMCVVLMHPDVFDDKLVFLREFIAHAKNEDLWLGSLEKFGNWWAARNEVSIDVTKTSGRYIVEADVPVQASGLTLTVPAGWKLSGHTAADIKVEQRGRRVVLEQTSGKLDLYFIEEEKH